ncbi:hypothetical protein RUM44_000715 [Polyplax serrata]|uniref:Uncharacterized protein n=1 Tax=Polyplax serrata TaxID=468196 RepID=A0ABR1B8G7_POLSC
MAIRDGQKKGKTSLREIPGSTCKMCPSPFQKELKRVIRNPENSKRVEKNNHTKVEHLKKKKQLEITRITIIDVRIEPFHHLTKTLKSSRR